MYQAAATGFGVTVITEGVISGRCFRSSANCW